MGTFTVMSMQMRNANRIVGVDVARAVALIGMICAHLTFPDGVLGEVLYGFPAALFGLLAGVSMGLMHDRGARPMNFVVRGLIIIAIGMVLSLVPSSIVIVLGTLGICMVVLAWAPGQGSGVLAGCVAAAALISGLAYAFLPFGLGVYPIFMWLALLLSGILVQRHLLGRPVRLAVAAVLGLGLMAADIASRWYLELPMFLEAQGHTGGLADVIGSVGASVGIVALCCLVAQPWQIVLPRMGTMPLTLYFLHVPTSLFIGVVPTLIGAAVFATVWLAVFKRGPMEEAVRRGVTAGTDWIERKRNEKSIGSGSSSGHVLVDAPRPRHGEHHLRR